MLGVGQGAMFLLDSGAQYLDGTCTHMLIYTYFHAHIPTDIYVSLTMSLAFTDLLLCYFLSLIY